MKNRLFKTLILLSLVIFIIFSIFAVYFSYKANYRIQRSYIINYTEMAKSAYRTYDGDLDFLDEIKFPNGYRISYFSQDGQAIYDSTYGDNPNLEDQEIGVDHLLGKSTSRFLGLRQGSLYSSVQLYDGSIIRLSTGVGSIFAYGRNYIPWLFLIYLFVLFLFKLVINRLVLYIISPLDKDKLEIDDIDLDETPELGNLVSKVKKDKEEREEKLQNLKIEQSTMMAILENMKQGMIILDDKKEIITISQEALDLLSWDKDTTNVNIIYLMRDENFLEDVNRSLEEGEVSGLLNIDKKIIRYYLTPVDIEKQKRGTIVLFIDETQRIQNETIRREFSSNVSHELKTPLTSISGFAELLVNDMVKEEDKKDFYTGIFNESQRLLSLIEDIMVISKLEEGNLVDNQSINLRKLIDDIIYSYSSQIKNQDLTINITGDETIQSNYNLVWRIFSNIIQNAIKYNKESGFIDVVISKESANVKVTVEDTGLGIGDEDLDRIFERFFRAERSRTKTRGGTGLGLSIVKHSVNSLNGDVKIESKINQGTKVSIRLPLEEKVGIESLA